MGRLVNLLISVIVSAHSFFCASWPAGDLMYADLL